MAHTIFRPNQNWELGNGFYGGILAPDPKDPRDFKVFPNALRLGLPAEPPRSWDGRAQVYPDLYDQGQIGSCVAWGGRRKREEITIKAGHGRQPLSALDFYARARVREGFPVTQDTGLYIRSFERELRLGGFAREEDWPYDVSKAFQLPPERTKIRAAWYKNVRTYRIESILELKTVIAAGHGVVFGVDLWSNVWDVDPMAERGTVPEPRGWVIGGHCWYLCSYIDDSSAPGGTWFGGPNSWASFTRDGWLWVSRRYLEQNDALPDMWTAALDRGVQPPEM